MRARLAVIVVGEQRQRPREGVEVPDVDAQRQPRIVHTDHMEMDNVGAVVQRCDKS